MTDRRFRFIVNTVFFALLAALFYASLKFILPLVLPFVIAFACAAALQRPIQLLSSRLRRIPQKLTASAVILLSLATIGTAAVLIIGGIAGELSGFINDLPDMLATFADRISSGQTSASGFIDKLPPSLRKYASELYSRLSEDIPGLLLSAAEGLSGLLIDSFGAIGSFAMRLPSFIITVLITVVSIFFIGLDYDSARHAIAEITPASLKARIVKIKECSADTVLCLLKTYAFLMLLTFSELAVGFAFFNLIGANIPYPVPLALLTSVVDILPVLGVGTVLIPWAVFDFIAGNIARGIMLLILYAVVVIIRNILEPKLIGSRFGLHPVITLLAIYTGGKLFGFIGVFLLPLSVIVAKRLRDSGVFTQSASTACRK